MSRRVLFVMSCLTAQYVLKYIGGEINVHPHLHTRTTLQATPKLSPRSVTTVLLLFLRQFFFSHPAVFYLLCNHIYPLVYTCDQLFRWFCVKIFDRRDCPSSLEPSRFDSVNSWFFLYSVSVKWFSGGLNLQYQALSFLKEINWTEKWSWSEESLQLEQVSSNLNTSIQ